MRRLAAEATKRGTVAGDLLGLIYQRSAHRLDEPSLGKAIAHYKEWALGGRYGDGEALKISEQTLRTYWSEFEPVAHLWGAFRLNRPPYSYAADPLGTADGLAKMLGVARDIAAFAETFVPKRTKPPKPIIQPGATLRIPESIPALQLKIIE